MKNIAPLLILSLGMVPVFAQQAPVDKDAPALSLDEKINLTTDDVKRQDIIEKLQKQFADESKPIDDHENATKAIIEKEHPGYELQNGPQGWHLTKKVEPPKPPAKK